LKVLKKKIQNLPKRKKFRLDTTISTSPRVSSLVDMLDMVALTIAIDRLFLKINLLIDG
jgi:hypothetical protein